MNTIEEFTEYLKKGDIYLYGAGTVGKKCLYFCSKRNIEIKGFVVSIRDDNPFEIDRNPVRTLEEWENAGIKPEQMNIVVALSGGTVQWINEFLGKPRFKSLVFISDTLKENLRILELIDKYEDTQNVYKINHAYPRSEVRLGALIEKATGLPICRVAQIEGMQLLDSLVKNATRENIEREFGRLRHLPYVKHTGLSEEAVQNEKIEVYIATSHLDKANVDTLKPKGFIPIQCGAALTDIRKGFITDNTGKNISEKNKDYSECTGLYWIWKNTFGQNYVGLCHYRRRLILDDRSVQYLMDNDIDAVVTLPQFERLCIRETFRRYLTEADWLLLKQKVIEYDKRYEEYFNIYENGHFYFPCNVNLWKRKWFDKYCEFAFQIVESIDTYYRECNIIREDRFAGYLFEQLPSLFIMYHHTQMKIVSSEIEWVE